VRFCRVIGASAIHARCMIELTKDALREIEQIHSNWIEYEVAGDNHSLMALWADDIELWPPDAQPLLGRAAISAQMARGNRGSTTQQLQGRDDDRDRSWGVWSHYCTFNEDGEVVGWGRFRTTPSGVEKWFTDLPPVRIAMEAGTYSIWISEQLQERGHEVIVANVRELRAISHSDRKSDPVDAEKLARLRSLSRKH
jgi:hypothetical protein